MKYGVVIFPSKELQDIANSYRKRYDKKFAFISPHITVKSAFEANDEEIKRFITKLKQAAKEITPFSIQVTKVKSFHPANNTIYFKVEDSPELAQLHKALYDDELFKYDEEYAYVPHLTIAQELSNDEHLDILGQLTNLTIDRTEIIEAVHLLYQQENNVWKHYETFQLGAE